MFGPKSLPNFKEIPFDHKRRRLLQNVFAAATAVASASHGLLVSGAVAKGVGKNATEVLAQDVGEPEILVRLVFLEKEIMDNFGVEVVFSPIEEKMVVLASQEEVITRGIMSPKIRLRALEQVKLELERNYDKDISKIFRKLNLCAYVGVRPDSLLGRVDRSAMTYVFGREMWLVINENPSDNTKNPSFESVHFHHEIAHLITIKLIDKFGGGMIGLGILIEKWIKDNYPQDKKPKYNGLSYGAMLNGPRPAGFYNNYGQSDPLEDMATVIEILYNFFSKSESEKEAIKNDIKNDKVLMKKCRTMVKMFNEVLNISDSRWRLLHGLKPDEHLIWE